MKLNELELWKRVKALFLKKPQYLCWVIDEVCYSNPDIGLELWAKMKRRVYANIQGPWPYKDKGGDFIPRTPATYISAGAYLIGISSYYGRLPTFKNEHEFRIAILERIIHMVENENENQGS